MVKSENFPLGSRKRWEGMLFPLLFSIVLEDLVTASRPPKRKWGIQIGKEEVKLPLFADDIILYLENSKDSTNKLLKLINEFSEVSGYKIYIQKSVAFLYIKNELSETGIKQTISYCIKKKKKG